METLFNANNDNHNIEQKEISDLLKSFIRSRFRWGWGFFDF